MQAIQTKYVGPTNTKGARIIARYQGGKIIVGWDYAKDVTENHLDAALALATKLDWLRHTHGWAHGTLPDGSFCLAFNPRLSAHVEGVQI